jgi:predicted ABC-type exoprotein transport system permease subunit
MGNWSQQQELKKEAKEKDKIRKEKLASYFLNLSQLTFVALVLGGITPLYTHIETEINWYVLVAGVLLTVILATVGNKILK